jgi:hypothetical protein
VIFPWLDFYLENEKRLEHPPTHPFKSLNSIPQVLDRASFLLLAGTGPRLEKRALGNLYRPGSCPLEALENALLIYIPSSIFARSGFLS